MQNTYKNNKQKTYRLLDLADGLGRGASVEVGVFERGVGELLAQRAPLIRARGGVPLPTRALARDLMAGTATAGGNIVGVGLLPVAQAARPQLVLEQLGAQVLELEAVGEATLPRWSGALGTGVWIAENAPAPSFSPLGVASAQLSAKQAAARIAYSRRLAAGVSDRGAFEAALLREVRRAVAQVVEAGLLAGTGSSGQPLGLLNTPGRQTKTFGGAVPSQAELADMLELLAGADADLNSSGWLLHPADAAALLKTLISANGGETVLQAIGSREWLLLGLPVAMSRNVPEGSVLLADWARLEVAYFGPPVLLVDPFSGGKSMTGATELHVANFVDCAMSEPDCLVVGSM
jgi:HK97 family phage major capsid protein